MKKRLIHFDWAMKKMLRHKANFDILEGFLSELLGEDITIKHILDSESNKETEDDKFNRVDILVENENGELVIIEVQNSKEYDYFHRMLYGAAKAISEHISEGQSYSHVKKVISITIAYFDLGQGKDYVYHGTTVFKGIHQNDVLTLADKQIELYNKASIHEIFPEFWIIKVSKFDDEIHDKLDEWIYFFKNAEIKTGFSAKGLQAASERLDAMKLNEEEARAYRRYLKDLRDIASEQHTKMADAEDYIKKGMEKGLKKGLEEGLKKGLEEGLKKGLEEGMEKGLKEGMEKGLKEGIEKGLKEGKEEGLRKGKEEKEIETVLGLYENGVPIEIIAKSLNISIEKVNQIVENQ